MNKKITVIINVANYKWKLAKNTKLHSYVKKIQKKSMLFPCFLLQLFVAYKFCVNL